MHRVLCISPPSSPSALDMRAEWLCAKCPALPTLSTCAALAVCVLQLQSSSGVSCSNTVWDRKDSWDYVGLHGPLTEISLGHSTRKSSTLPAPARFRPDRGLETRRNQTISINLHCNCSILGGPTLMGTALFVVPGRFADSRPSPCSTPHAVAARSEHPRMGAPSAKKGPHAAPTSECPTPSMTPRRGLRPRSSTRASGSGTHRQTPIP